MSSRHHGKRKHAPPREEPQVDDLLVASMAVASAWSPPSVENTESSDDDNDDDDDDGRNYCQDAHEIVLEDEPPEHTITSSTNDDAVENNDTKIEEQKSIDEESDDDESDIDLTDHLAVMEEEDEVTAVSLIRTKDKNNTSSSSSSAATSAALGIYRGPKTEHEMDDALLYPCPVIDELAKLNVRVGTTTATTTTADKSNSENDDSKLDEATASKLRVAGVIRSYLVEQRTVVVDSLIPSSSQNSLGNTNNNTTAMDNPLDEGSVMAILLTTNNNRNEVTISASLSEANSVQILGKVVEVFGPVQRPLYVIRLPEPPKVESADRKAKVSGSANGKQSAKQSGDEIESETKCSTAQIDEDTVAHDTKVTDGEIKDTDREQALEGPTSSSTACEKRNISDLSTKVEDPWCIGGKVSTVLRNTPNAIVYSVVDHSTVINKDQIIKISGKGCGKSLLSDSHLYLKDNCSSNILSFLPVDASNMFDEEVSPSEAQDFSDDEDERQAKKGNRKPRQPSNNVDRSDRATNFGGRSTGGRGRGKGYNRSNVTNNQHGMHPQPFNPPQHIAPMQHQYHTQNAQHLQQSYPQHGYQQLYRGGQPMQYYQQPPHHIQHGNYGAFPGYNYGAPPPPPPPPPRQQNQAAAPQNDVTVNRNQTSSCEGDTIYYDYSGS